MKSFFSILTVALVFGSSSSADTKNPAGSRPNIILVMTDDQGMGDLSCMGNKVIRTPHIDQFHKRSTRFTDFQVSPTCAPFKNSAKKNSPSTSAIANNSRTQESRSGLPHHFKANLSAKNT